MTDNKKLSDKLWTYFNNSALNIFCANADRVWTFANLSEQILNCNDILKKNKINAGAAVLLIGDFQFELAAMYFALLKSKCIITLSASLNGDLIDNIVDHNSISFIVSMNETGLIVQKTYSVLVQNPIYDLLLMRKHAGIIIFSSGTTGKAKAVVHDFEIFLLNFNFDKSYENRVLFFLPWYMIGGQFILFKSIFTQSILIECKDKNIARIPEYIEKNRISFLPATPSILAMLLLTKFWVTNDISSLKLIVYGSERANDHVIKQLSLHLPGVKLRQTYGSTELGLLETRSESISNYFEITDSHVCTDTENLTLKIKSDKKAIGHFENGNYEPYTDWMDTKDTFIASGKYLKITGRDNEIFNISGQKVQSSEIYSVLIKIEGVLDVKIFAEYNILIGDQIVAAFIVDTIESELDFRNRARIFCRSHLDSYKIPAKFLVVKTLLGSNAFKK